MTGDDRLFTSGLSLPGEAPPVDEHVLEVLSPEECVRLLARGVLGRIGVSVGALPTILPVNYVVFGRDVIFRSAPGSKLDAAVQHRVVAFEVDGLDLVGRTGWSVVVVGTAAPAEETYSSEFLRALPLQPWCGNHKDRFVRVPIEVISGRRAVAAPSGESEPSGAGLRVTPPADTLIEIRHDPDVGAARRCARDLAVRSGVSAAAAERACIAVTELGTNILRHGGGRGVVLLRPLSRERRPGLQVLAVDHGPGIGDVPAALAGAAQGVAARGRRAGLGVGLGSVQRAADSFDVHTRPGAGTVVLARFLFHGRKTPKLPPKPGSSPPTWLRWGGVSVPVRPDGGNGDAWSLVGDESHVSLLLADSAGYGHDAREAALGAFETYQGDPLAWINQGHELLTTTRRAGLAVARIDRTRRVVEFAGRGRISGRIIDPQRTRHLASTPSTTRAAVHSSTVRLVEERWDPGSTLLLWSDGISCDGDLDDGQDLLSRDPAVIAAVVHRDFQRAVDDATVIVVHDPVS